MTNFNLLHYVVLWHKVTLTMLCGGIVYVAREVNVKLLKHLISTERNLC